MLDHVAFPLTQAQISSFILDKGYTNYLTLQQAIAELDENNLLTQKQAANRTQLIITPEGTRKYTDRWKKGFYHIAMKAQKPIYLAWLDYEKKQGGSGPIFYPTGNYEEDIKKIEEFYRDKVAKYPENFNLSKQYQNKKQCTAHSKLCCGSSFTDTAADTYSSAGNISGYTSCVSGNTEQRDLFRCPHRFE